MKLGLDKTKKYGLAISGGVDSMVLMELAFRENLSAVVLTVDHDLRSDSGDDVKFVIEQAKLRGFDTRSIKIDVKNFANDNDFSIELAARELRYQFFEKQKEELNLDYILLAHHLDDQLETVLMRIFRGTGISGLKGIENRDFYLRPLLKYEKAEIVNFAKENRIEFHEDYTNAESKYKRNFIRNKVIPLIKTEYPSVSKSILRLVESAAETEDYFADKTLDFSDSLGGVKFGEDIFTVHPAIAKRSVLKGVKSLGIYKDIESKTYGTIFSLKDMQSNASVDIGQGLVAIRDYDGLIIKKKEERTFCEEKFCINFEYEFCGKKYSFEKSSAIKKGVTLDLSKIPPTAVVRTRKTGDTFKRCNGYRKSLSDYFTDEKISKDERDKFLLVADCNEILLILGKEVSDLVKVDKDTTEQYCVISNE